MSSGWTRGRKTQDKRKHKSCFSLSGQSPECQARKNSDNTSNGLTDKMVSETRVLLRNWECPPKFSGQVSLLISQGWEHSQVSWLLGQFADVLPPSRSALSEFRGWPKTSLCSGKPTPVLFCLARLFLIARRACYSWAFAGWVFSRCFCAMFSLFCSVYSMVGNFSTP